LTPNSEDIAMPEFQIDAAVGTQPAPNRVDDVRTVQDLLTQVQPPLAANVAITGAMDRVTLDAIREFQHRFMANPDGRVTPDDRTIWHLNDGSVPQYIALSPKQRLILDHDIIAAQKWLTHVNSRLLNAADADMVSKVLNVFHIAVNNPLHGHSFRNLKDRFILLRDSFDVPFPLELDPGQPLELAWVDLNDAAGTMHFPATYFRAAEVERIEKIIHERAHTVLRVRHEGMAGGGEVVDFNPGDPNPFTLLQAMGNAYCYGWLANALQPGYRPRIRPMHFRAIP
jgi:hypothetical protein